MPSITFHNATSPNFARDQIPNPWLAISPTQANGQTERHSCAVATRFQSLGTTLQNLELFIGNFGEQWLGDRRVRKPRMLANSFGDPCLDLEARREDFYLDHIQIAATSKSSSTSSTNAIPPLIPAAKLRPVDQDQSSNRLSCIRTRDPPPLRQP